MLLDHVNLRCHDPDAMARFLEALGIAHRAARPAFDTPGFWMHDDSDRPVVHLSAHATAPDGDGVVDHVAFRTGDLAAIRKTLASIGIDYRERDNPLAGVTQLKIPGPEGLVIEIQAPLR